MIEINITIILSVIALALSAYSVILSKKRGESTDLKELSGVLATLTTKLDTIEKAVLGKPTLSEQVVVNTQKITDHERRIAVLEKTK